MALNDQDIQNLRVSYQKHALDEAQVAALPLDQFKLWFQEAMEAQCEEPNTFSLATISDGRPRGRIVLFKGYFQDGLVFYTNYLSSKGQELEQNPFAAATFFWPLLQRQVRIEATVMKVPPKISDDYFASRPYGSQIGAVASPQDEVVGSRNELERLFAQTEKQFPAGTNVPRPAHWGGYVLMPQCWEFWQGRPNRLHDRIRYRLDGKQWIRARLAP